MKTCRRSRGKAPLFLNLGARWREVVNITFRPLYLREITQFNRRLGGPQSFCGFLRKEKILYVKAVLVQAMKSSRVKTEFDSFLTLALNGGGWSASLSSQ
jgi:hypothetical protein